MRHDMMSHCILSPDIWVARSELSASHDSNSTLASQPDSEREDSEENTKHRYKKKPSYRHAAALKCTF